MKARLTLIVLKEYLFTLDVDKRKLFFFLLGLVRKKKLAIDKAMGYLISMLGYHRHIEIHKQNMETYREMIRTRDEGPFISRKLQDSPAVP